MGPGSPREVAQTGGLGGRRSPCCPRRGKDRVLWAAAGRGSRPGCPHPGDNGSAPRPWRDWLGLPPPGLGSAARGGTGPTVAASARSRVPRCHFLVSQEARRDHPRGPGAGRGAPRRAPAHGDEVPALHCHVARGRLLGREAQSHCGRDEPTRGRARAPAPLSPPRLGALRGADRARPDVTALPRRGPNPESGAAWAGPRAPRGRAKTPRPPGRRCPPVCLRSPALRRSSICLSVRFWRARAQTQHSELAWATPEDPARRWGARRQPNASSPALAGRSRIGLESASSV